MVLVRVPMKCRVRDNAVAILKCKSMRPSLLRFLNGFYKITLRNLLMVTLGCLHHPNAPFYYPHQHLPIPASSSSPTRGRNTTRATDNRAPSGVPFHPMRSRSSNASTIPYAPHHFAQQNGRSEAAANDVQCNLMLELNNHPTQYTHCHPHHWIRCKSQALPRLLPLTERSRGRTQSPAEVVAGQRKRKTHQVRQQTPESAHIHGGRERGAKYGGPALGNTHAYPHERNEFDTAVRCFTNA